MFLDLMHLFMFKILSRQSFQTARNASFLGIAAILRHIDYGILKLNPLSFLEIIHFLESQSNNSWVIPELHPSHPLCKLPLFNPHLPLLTNLTCRLNLYKGYDKPFVIFLTLIFIYMLPPHLRHSQELINLNSLTTFNFAWLCNVLQMRKPSWM